MLHITKHVDARVLWTNLHLLFWLSLVPVVTGWVGENPEATAPAACYGAVLLFAALAFNLLSRAIRRGHRDDSIVVAALAGTSTKGRISELMYASAIGLAFVHPWIADTIYIAVAVMWFVPSRQIEAAAKH